MNAKNIYPDLFPETLLVAIEGEQVFTTSLKVAEYFEKRHTHVLRAVESLLDASNFGRTSNKNKEGDETKIGLISDKKNEEDKRKIAPISDEVSAFFEANFELSVYVDNRNRKKPMYKMTEEGFALLAMGFTGQKAFEWKIQFLNAFRAMERQLQERNNRWMRVIDQVRPSLRPVVEGTEQNLSRAEIAERIGKSVNSVTYYRRRGRQFEVLH